MLYKKLLITTLLLIANSHIIFCNYEYFFTFSGPDPDNKYKVESIPQKILNNTRFESITPDPWDSWDSNQSGGSGWEDFKVFWKGVGQGFKKAGKGIGKGIVFVAKSIGKGGHYALEGICDCAEWTGDIVDNMFDPEEPLEIRCNRIKQQQAQQHAKDTNNVTSIPVIAHTQPTPSAHTYATQCTTIEESMIEQQPSFAAYEEELSLNMSQLEHMPYQHVYDRLAKRLDAFKAHEHNQTPYKETYALSEEITPYMRRHALDVQSFEVCNGTLIQHHLHQEIIEILTTNCEIERIFTEHQQTALFTDLVVEGADLARECNKQGKVVDGFKIADYCGWLNEAEYPRLASFVKQTAGIAIGTVEGGINIVKNTYHMVRHPLDTGEALICILGQASIFLFHGVQEVGPLAFHLSFHGTPEGYQIHPHFAQDIKAIKDFFNQTVQELAQLPPEERTRKIMAFFTELYFTGKFIGQVAKIKRAATANIIKPGATSLANKLQLYRYKAISETYTRIASTVSHTQNMVKATLKNWVKSPDYSYELAMDGAGNWRWVYDINPASLEGAVAECTNLVSVEKTQGVLKRTSMTEIIRSTIQENAIELLPGASGQALSIATPGYIPLSKEIDYLRSLFDKTREDWRNQVSPNKSNEIRYLKIKYEHILDIDLSSGKPQGLHHDYLGHYENNGILQLENKIVGKFGEYGGRPKWNGIGLRDKTYFPQQWTRKQVIENILEAYDNFTAKGIEQSLAKSGKYCIESSNNSGMRIMLIIDQNCNLLSAYPII